MELGHARRSSQRQETSVYTDLGHFKIRPSPLYMVWAGGQSGLPALRQLDLIICRPFVGSPKAAMASGKIHLTFNDLRATNCRIAITTSAEICGHHSPR
jgi:hypothetical protein